MSIVADDTVSKALAYLADDPHPVAVARKAVTDAENARKAKFAELYRGTNGGTVRDREASVECHDLYKKLQDAESEAIFEHERHRARVRAAEMIIEVWRSTNANARAAERVR